MSDVTVKILRGIRDDIRDVHGGLGRVESAIRETNVRVDHLAAELLATRDELSRRIVESEVRTASALTDLAGSVREMTGVLRAQHDLRPRVEKCEQDIAELRATSR